MPHFQPNFLTLALSLFLSLGLASCIEPREYQSSLHFRVSLRQQPLISPDQEFLSFMGVRDIFHRYNCVVCHRKQKDLDLRRYPFWKDGKRLSAGATQKILEQLGSTSSGHQNLPWLNGSEMVRLQEWLQHGAVQDPSSPLQKKSSEAFHGSIVVQYHIAAQSGTKTEVPLIFNRQEQVYTGSIRGLPQGCLLEARIILRDSQGLPLLEQTLQELIVEAEADKIVLIDLPSGSAI